MHTATNPYRAPTAHVEDHAAASFSQINIWSSKGRLGRLRYIGYSMGIGLLINVLISAGVAMTGPSGALPIGIVGLVASVWIYLLLSIQRTHDFNTTGWLSILAFVPLLNFIFWCIPGTDGANRFGQKTPPNSTMVIVLACTLVFVMIAGIIAAIALPAYTDHARRTEMSQPE